MKGKCKLCGNEAKLCRSHIVPEFFYDNIYDKNPKKFWYLKSDSESKSKKHEQKGLREYLLCKSCENKLGAYEKYAAEIIYAKNKKSPVKRINAIQSKNMVIYEFENFDYEKFKQFLISILWRLSISEKYMNTVKISDEAKEELRKSIDENSVLDEDNYVCFVQIITHTDDKIFGSTILSPYESKLDKKQVLNVLIDGYLFSFIIGKAELQSSIKAHILNKNGKMSIVKRPINSDPYLMDAVSKMVNDFGDLYK